MIRHLGIGGRLALAFALIAAMSLLAAGLARQTSSTLEKQLDDLRGSDISVLATAALLNDTNRRVVASVPRIVTAESAYNRREARLQLDQALQDMKRLMQDLPDYDNYFRDISSQISNSVGLLYLAVEHREKLVWQGYGERQLLFPLYQGLIRQLEHRQTLNPGNRIWPALLRRIEYLAGLAEKIANDSSFNELDYTFLRLESLSDDIRALLKRLPNNALTFQQQQQLDHLLMMASRQGELFRIKNDELDFRYQESYLMRVSQDHIRQLAIQIGHYTLQVNDNIDEEIEKVSAALERNSRLALTLSLISLFVAAGVSWWYVRQNVLGRIRYLQSCMRAIAAGELATEVSIRGRDEVATMGRDLQHFQQTALKEARIQRQLQSEIQERLMAERQLRKTQEELIQAGKLAALGQLSVAITHEINQPLTAISSHLHTAGRWLDNDRPDRARNSLDKIKILLEKTAGITRHLRGFARKSDSDNSAVRLLPVINAAIELVSPKAGFVNIARNCPEHLYVMAEPIRLEQVLVNVLSNALDAVSGREMPRIRLDVSQHAGLVDIAVTDNGCGIAPELIGQIFDPYYTDKAPEAGLGLGLAISYNIMQDFNGQILVHSEPEQGSCFTLQLHNAPEEWHADSAD
ncbi:ATP-binding protein [Oceanospirillum sediminis]|uniref:C4-dicarboxylate transport sensor protein DctB n=1 Tax=Oceanospirillum sediminis TaxID=2760088 RepID=A0A839IR33_9GAMM|nr:ATP-binding protein [Oceanospirillum sediminis]MBB1487381.1 HAMP domain-containing protein [Oceanospirillum sediminis]